MTMQAVRTVSETDDVHVIEGLLAYDGPFGGRDSYGTYFSARTAWGLDLHPQGIPVLYNHGFDNDIGLTPLGFTTPPASFRADDDGLWVQMQLDKREKYYATRVRPLLDKGALGISQGSAEHSVRIDEKSGEVLAWPLHEVSLTPTESNPYNVVAARSGETDVIHVIEALRGVPPGDWAKSDARLEGLVARDEATRTEPEFDEHDTDAIRAGAEFSSKNRTHLDAIHQHAAAIMSHTGAMGAVHPMPADEPDAASRSAEPLISVTFAEPREDVAAVRARLLQTAAQVGEDVAKAMLD